MFGVCFEVGTPRPTNHTLDRILFVSELRLRDWSSRTLEKGSVCSLSNVKTCRPAIFDPPKLEKRSRGVPEAWTKQAEEVGH